MTAAKEVGMEKLLRQQNAILCVIDFSESSRRTLQWAISLAELTNAHVTVLYCYRLIASGDDQETLDVKRELEDEASRKFDALRKDLGENHQLTFSFLTEIGFYPFRIEMFLRKKPAGLIVMGNSIIDNFNEYKSMNFDQFLKTVNIPVVVVPGSK